MVFVVFLLDRDTRLHTYLFDQSEVIMGRSPDCDLVLQEVSVSKQHGKLTLIDNALYISDLGSSNGIVINRKKISSTVQISASDQVNIRGFQIVARILSTEEHQELELNPNYLPSAPSHFSTTREQFRNDKRRNPKNEPINSVSSSALSQEHVLLNKKKRHTVDLNSSAKDILQYHSHNQSNIDQKSTPDAHLTVQGMITTTEKDANDHQNDSEVHSLSAQPSRSDIPQHSAASRQSKSLNSIFDEVNPLSTNGSKPETKPLENLHDELVPNNPNHPKQPQPKSLNSIFNAVTPINHEHLSENSTEASPSKPRSLHSLFNAINPINKVYTTGRTIDEPLCLAIGTQLSALLADPEIIELSLNGAQNLIGKRLHQNQYEVLESPFTSGSEAKKVAKAVLYALGHESQSQGEGRIGQFWCYVNLNIPNGAHLSISLIPELKEALLPPFILESINSQFNTGASLLLVGEYPQTLTEFTATLLKQSAIHHKLGFIGIKYNIGEAPGWFHLGSNNLALDQALALGIDRLIVANLPSLTGSKICEALIYHRANILMVSANSLTEGVQQLRRKVANDALLFQSIDYLGFVDNNANGTARMTSLYTYPDAQEIY